LTHFAENDAHHDIMTFMTALVEIIPAKNPGGLADWKPLPPREDGVSLSDALIAMREEERW